MSLLNRKPAPKNSYRPYNSPGRVREAYGINRAQEKSPFRRRGFVIASAFVGIIFAVVIGVMVVGTVAGGFWKTSTMEGCIVTEKSTAVVDGYSEYRIHTKNCDVLTISDSHLDGQYYSASLYTQVQAGETYTFETRGARFGPLSIFPNIISVQQTS